MAMYINACKRDFKDFSKTIMRREHTVYLFCSADGRTHRLDEIEEKNLYQKFGEETFLPIRQIDAFELMNRFIDSLPDDLPREGVSRILSEWNETKPLEQPYALRPDIDMPMKERFRQAQNMKDFNSACQLFHLLTMDYGLDDAWTEFEDRELTTAAITWCEEQGIKYTLDEPPPQEISAEVRAFNEWLESSDDAPCPISL